MGGNTVKGGPQGRSVWESMIMNCYACAFSLTLREGSWYHPAGKHRGNLCH